MKSTVGEAWVETGQKQQSCLRHYKVLSQLFSIKTITVWRIPGTGTPAWCCRALTGARWLHYLKNTAHPQVRLINLARHCWSNKPGVAVWLSLFSQNDQSALRAREAASNPAEEFNPCRLTWVPAPQRLVSHCLKIPGARFELRNTSDPTHKSCYTAPPEQKRLITLQKSFPTTVKYTKCGGEAMCKVSAFLFNWFRLFCCLTAVGWLLSWGQVHVFLVVLFRCRVVYWSYEVSFGTGQVLSHSVIQAQWHCLKAIVWGLRWIGGEHSSCNTNCCTSWDKLKWVDASCVFFLFFFFSWLFFTGLDAHDLDDELDEVGQFGNAAEKLLPIKLVPSLGSWLSVTWNERLSRTQTQCVPSPWWKSWKSCRAWQWCTKTI